MREIVFDTETTGFDPFSGDRLIEIGCVEIVNKIATGETFHMYVNPEREVPEAAVKVHGITTEMLLDKPLFYQVADDFLAFVADSPLVAHNAGFDQKFINFELEKAGRPSIEPQRFVDTLMMARDRFPGAQNSLDALCRRFGVDNTNRTLHGALLDAEILAEVYLELMGGRQRGLELAADRRDDAGFTAGHRSGSRPRREPRAHAPSAAELERHATFVEKLSNALWTR